MIITACTHLALIASMKLKYRGGGGGGGDNSKQNTNLAVCSKGCRVPTNFLMCSATLDSSSLSKHRRLRNDVGYPTILSASDTTLFHSLGLLKPKIPICLTVTPTLPGFDDASQSSEFNADNSLDFCLPRW